MENIIWDRVSNNSNYVIEARSCIGGRSEQQDFAYLYCDEHNLLAVVCDGMGGTANGDIASRTTIFNIRQAYKEYLLNPNDTPDSFLYHAMTAADREVSKKLDYKPGGTTIVAVLIQDGRLYWLSVGDSRLYILRSGEFVQVTRDHNYLLRLNELQKRGEISEVLYQKESVRGNALISYIGMGNISLFDLTQKAFQLHSGDKLLLTTDGLFSILTSASMKEIIDSQCNSTIRADTMITALSEQAEKEIQDNTTFITIDVL